MNPGLRVALGLLALVSAVATWFGCARSQPGEIPPDGLIVEQVEAGYGAARAGVLPGDVLVAWFAKTGDSDSHWRPLIAPLDLDLAELEGGQQGSVTMRIWRGGEPLHATLPPAPWKVRVRPRLGTEAEGALAESHVRLADGQLDQALARWRELRGDASPAIGAWLSIQGARTLTEADRNEDAGAWVDAAVQATGNSGSPNLVAWTWLGVGDLWQDARDYPAAVVAYLQGLQIRGVDRPLSARLQRALADARFRASDYSRAGEAYRQTRERWDEMGIRGAEYVAATIGLGKARRNESRFERAQELLEQAERVAARMARDHPQVGFALQEQGMLAYWRSDLAQAAKRYRAATEVLGGLGITDNNLAYLHMGLGAVSLDRGQVASATESFATARSIFRQNAPGSLLEAWSLRGLGAVARVRNELDLARLRYEDALRILDPTTPHRMDRAHVLYEVGLVAHMQGDLETAERMVTDALQIFESEYSDSKFPPRIRTALASMLQDRGEVDTARIQLITALAEWRRLVPGSLDQADTHFRLGELSFDSGDMELARSHHEAALAIRSRLSPHSSNEAESRHALARVALATGSRQHALDHLLGALQSIEAQLGSLGLSELSRARFRQRHAKAYRATIRLLLQLGDQVAAFDVLERYRTQQGREILEGESLRLQRTSRPELMQRHRRLVNEYEATWRRLSDADPGPSGGEEVKRLRNRLAELEQERQIVRERLRAENARATILDPTPARWIDLRNRLDPGVTILSYVVTREDSWLFAVRGGELQVSSLGAGEGRLSDLVDRFRLLLAAEGPGGAGRRTIERVGGDLYRLILSPAASLTEPAKELVILADGPLHRLPFAALRDPVTGRYLAQQTPLSMRASLTGYQPLRMVAGEHPSGSSTRHGLLAFGRVSETAVRTPELPFTGAEVASLKRLFGRDAEVRVDHRANERAVKHRAGAFRYLHFATHARLDSALPLDSFLVLARPRPDDEERDDGLLRAWEVIEEMELIADVVTLSACESGLGEEAAGYGLLGLTRAFQLAGARSVVASLWQVNDRSTSALMVRFYRGLRDGLPAHEALRQAQLELLRGEVTVPGHPPSSLDRMRTRLASLMGKPGRAEREHDYSHPHHWAAFQLYDGAGASQ